MKRRNFFKTALAGLLGGVAVGKVQSEEAAVRDQLVACATRQKLPKGWVVDTTWECTGKGSKEFRVATYSYRSVEVVKR